MVNPYDSCVWNSGSGMMKVARGKVHKYLGVTLDFATSKIVKVTMLEYVFEIIGSWDKACNELNDGYKAVSGRKRIATAAPNDLFTVDEDAIGPRHSTTSRQRGFMSTRKQGRIYPLALRSRLQGLRDQTLTIGASSVIWLSVSAAYVGYHCYLRLMA